MKKMTASAMLCLALFSCKKSETNFQAPANSKPPTVLVDSKGDGTIFREGEGEGGYCGTATTVNLMAGQHMISGTVTVANTADSVYVTYNTVDGWRMKEIHLYVGPYSGAPLSGGGNPQPGRFYHKATFSPTVDAYTAAIATASFPDCYIVAAHAVVTRNNAGGGSSTETGWGQGTQFPGNNWGMYFDYCKQVCE